MSGEGGAAKPASAGEALGGCGVLILLAMMASCVFGGADDDSAQAASAASQGPHVSTDAISEFPIDNDNAQPASGASQGPHVSTHAISEFPIDKEAREKREKEAKASTKAKSGPIKLSDLDEADRAIRRAINVSGHLCARPIEVVQAATDLYGVQCITNRDGTGISNYLVNARTSEVDPI